MLNIYLKVREAVAYSKCRFSKFKMFVSKSVFGEHQLTHISFNFLLQFKYERYESKTVCCFSIVFILKGINCVLKSESMLFVEQKHKL